MLTGKELLLSDANYSAWANQRLLDACSHLAPALLEQDLGASHSHILATLMHICDGERVWLDCLSTTPDEGSWKLPQEPGAALSLEDLKEFWPELWPRYQEWLSSVSNVGLGVRLIIHLPDGTSPSIQRWKILRHALDHSNFHRGQIVGMIRALGHTPPAINRMDYVLADG